MRRYQICVTALLAAMAVMTGCGKGGNASVEEQPPVDWKTEGFAFSGAVEEKQEYWVQKYIPWERDGVKLDEETEELYLGDMDCRGDL